MNKPLIATLSALVIVIGISTTTSYANGLKLERQENLIEQISKANQQATELQKIIYYIDTIISECKPMTHEELNRLLH